MKFIGRVVFSLFLMPAMLISCNAFTSTPVARPTSVEIETAVNVTETVVSISTATLSPTPGVSFPVITRDNVAQISEIARWQTNPSSGVIWNENSKEIFIPEGFDSVIVYDVSSFQRRQISLAEYKQLNPILFTDETAEQGSCSNFGLRKKRIVSPDKTILATGWWYGHKQPDKTIITLWDLVENKCILQFPEYDGALSSLTFSSSGNYLVFSTDRATYVWSVKESEITCQIDYAWGAIFYPSEKDIIYLSDGLGEPGGLNGLWGIEKCEKIQEYALKVSDPVFSPDGELLIGISRNRILITDVETGELLKEIEIQPNQFLNLLLSPDGRFLLLINSGAAATEKNKFTYTIFAIQP